MHVEGCAEVCLANLMSFDAGCMSFLFLNAQNACEVFSMSVLGCLEEFRSQRYGFLCVWNDTMLMKSSA